MPKLNDTQLVILSAAARRKTGILLPLPKPLKADAASADKAIKALLRQKLIEEQPVEAGQAVWREQDDRRLTLVITDNGRTAIGEDVEPAEAEPAPEPTRAGTKAAGLVAMLRRPQGATIPDIMEATGWQAHSMRGAISGTVKKKMGLTVATAVEDGRGRVYRIVEA